MDDGHYYDQVAAWDFLLIIHVNTLFGRILFKFDLVLSARVPVSFWGTCQREGFHPGGDGGGRPGGFCRVEKVVEGKVCGKIVSILPRHPLVTHHDHHHHHERRMKRGERMFWNIDCHLIPWRYLGLLSPEYSIFLNSTWSRLDGWMHECMETPCVHSGKNITSLLRGNDARQVLWWRWWSCGVCNSTCVLLF